MGVRFGIIGLGGIAIGFARGLVDVDDAELYAVAARDFGRAEAFAQEYNAVKAYGCYDQLINDPSVDAVYIATTHNSHYELTKKCLENGKAVLCEKPFVLNRAHAQELFDIAAEKQLLLMEAMWSRFLPCYEKAKEWVDAGRIGYLKLITANCCFKADYKPEGRLFNPALAGGAMYDIGVYPIEFAFDFARELPNNIKVISTWADTGVDDFNLISLGFPNGVLASLTTGLSATTENDGKLYGTDGRIVLYDFLLSTKAELYDGAGKLVETYEHKFERGLAYETRHFVGLYRKGIIESDVVPWKDTIACAGVFDVMNKIEKV